MDSVSIDIEHQGETNIMLVYHLSASMRYSVAIRLVGNGMHWDTHSCYEHCTMDCRNKTRFLRAPGSEVKQPEPPSGGFI
jgi:hypothetical protein